MENRKHGLIPCSDCRQMSRWSFLIFKDKSGHGKIEVSRGLAYDNENEPKST